MTDVEETRREVQRMLPHLSRNDLHVDAEKLLLSYALRLPLGALVGIREAIQRHGGRGVGYAVAALRSEIEKRSRA